MIYNYTDIKFDLNKNGFQHNLEADFACFALWKEARPFLNQIREEFSKKYQVLLETEIQWSEENFHKNAERLYEAPLFMEKTNTYKKSTHGNKIGDTSFIVFILKDNTPNYTYAKSVSGKIEVSNLNFVNTKYKFRGWIEKETGKKYAVHSTNSILEFFFQVPLLLNADLFRRLLQGEVLNIPVITKDLEGANGWTSWNDFFEILNLTTNYMVLRGFENLPHENIDKDLDILTDNYQRFASSIGAVQKSDKQPYKGFVNVANETISLDIRFVGDNYYDTAWSKDMLATKTKYKDLIYSPRLDHYYFSLLFHAKVQKPEVKPAYYSILNEIALKLKYEWFELEDLDNNKICGNILKGFFEYKGYFYIDPIDKGVYKNIEVINYLPKVNNLVTKISFFEKAKRKISKILPESIKRILRSILNK